METMYQPSRSGSTIKCQKNQAGLILLRAEVIKELIERLPEDDPNPIGLKDV